MENCTFGEHPTVLVKLKLLANIAIYWPIPNLANKSEQIKRRLNARVTIPILKLHPLSTIKPIKPLVSLTRQSSPMKSFMLAFRHCSLPKP
jgi:hypothetical protein